ncbi:MAG: hypothetical protein IT261_03435 [Saprospiraceae bacterium]|nr:hypothetical protein [Saprospiraceae bacterium]
MKKFLVLTDALSTINRQTGWPLAGFGILLAGLVVYLGYWADRTHFISFFSVYSASFLVYALGIRYFNREGATSALTLLPWMGILLRAILLFSIPNLSDDYARFLWDGNLINAGIHPFTHTPEFWMQQPEQIPGLSPELYAKLNSPRYYTVYPPVCQLIFAFSTWIFPSWEAGSLFLIKLPIFLGEVGTILLLKRWGPQIGQPNAAIWYALNPLAILEFTGNCHFEGLMVFFMLAALWMLKKNKLTAGATLWSLAIATKLLPLLFVPAVWRWSGLRSGWAFAVRAGGITLILFVPILVALPNMLSSIDLYFRQFQFNASMYYLVREIGLMQTGWDIGKLSGPVMGLLGVLGIPLITWTIPSGSRNDTKLFKALTFGALWYLFFAATVQPWYLGIPLCFSLPIRFKSVVAWSLLVMLSYSHYEGNLYRENYPLILLEYVLFSIILIWELRLHKEDKAAEIFP